MAGLEGVHCTVIKLTLMSLEDHVQMIESDSSISDSCCSGASVMSRGLT